MTTYNRDAFVLKALPIHSDADRDTCTRLLLEKNRETTLQYSKYIEKHIRAYLESAKCVLYYHPTDAIEEVLCFAILTHFERTVDVSMLSAVPNNGNLENAILYAIYGYAILKKSNIIYVSPRTEDFYKIIVCHGYEQGFGVKGYGAVYEKSVGRMHIQRAKYTRRAWYHYDAVRDLCNIIRDSYLDD